MVRWTGDGGAGAGFNPSGMIWWMLRWDCSTGAGGWLVDSMHSQENSAYHILPGCWAKDGNKFHG